MPKAVVRDRDGYLRVFYEQARHQVPDLRRLDRVGRPRSHRCPCRHTDMPAHKRRDRGCHEQNSCLADDQRRSFARCIRRQRQQAFKTPDEAASALVSAAKAGDPKALVTVLGPDGEDIVSSGDEVADAATREKFVAAYDAKHQIAMEGDNKAIMVIGPDDFPLPIPLVRKDGTWRFDTAAGREEILFRRIGKNELDAIQAALAYVDAQNEYAEKDRTGAGVNDLCPTHRQPAGKKGRALLADVPG